MAQLSTAPLPSQLKSRRKAPTFVALLRTVNVRGTGKLPMDDPLLLRVKAGFDKVQTYIACGNVILSSRES